MLGSSDINNGVYGYSPGHKGTSGNSDSGFGVYATSNSGTGLYAKSTCGNAAQFDGNVVINGALPVSNSSYKSAAVPHPDGTTRRL